MNSRSHVFSTLEHYCKRGLLDVLQIDVKVNGVPENYKQFVTENEDLLETYVEKLKVSSSNLIGFVEGFCQLYDSDADNPLTVEVTKLWCSNLKNDPLSNPTEVMGLVAILYFEKLNEV